jgi:hypothetical protein
MRSLPSSVVARGPRPLPALLSVRAALPSGQCRPIEEGRLWFAATGSVCVARDPPPPASHMLALAASVAGVQPATERGGARATVQDPDEPQPPGRLGTRRSHWHHDDASGFRVAESATGN